MCPFASGDLGQCALRAKSRCGLPCPQLFTPRPRYAATGEHSASKERGDGQCRTKNPKPVRRHRDSLG